MPCIPPRHFKVVAFMGEEISIFGEGGVELVRFRKKRNKFSARTHQSKPRKWEQAIGSKQSKTRKRIKWRDLKEGSVDKGRWISGSQKHFVMASSLSLFFEWRNSKQSRCITAPAAPAAPAAQPATPLGLDPPAPARAVAPEAPEELFYIVERHLGGQMYPFCVWCWKLTNGMSRFDFSSSHFTGADHLKKPEMATQYKVGPVDCAECQEKFIIERDEFLAPRSEANDVTAAAAVNGGHGDHGDRLQMLESRLPDVEMAVGAILEMLQNNNLRGA